MRIRLLCIAKWSDRSHQSIGESLVKRIDHYCSFEMTVIESKKKAKASTPGLKKKLEAQLILKHIKPNDYVILLDEKGKAYTSLDWANQLNKWLIASHKTIVFVIGGAYGFGPSVYQRSNGLVALSAMTYSHQLIRLMFLEQLYRGFSLLNNEPYHNE